MPQTSDQHISVAQQIRLLLEWSEQQRHHTLREVAQAAGISTQALANILEGEAPDPRLNTLRGLSDFFQISLDYFACRTQEACQIYLARRSIQESSPTIRQITRASKQLSPRGQANILVILQWLNTEHSL
jgi:transcriptional regulator with XRE-family HTH domain